MHFLPQILNALSFVSDKLLYTISIVFAFGLVVFIHEFGHFIVAKKSGIKVLNFAFGFGKEIFGFMRGETRYSVNWLPLGGYVKMAGDVPEDYSGPVLEGKTEGASETGDHSREFLAQKWYRRIPVVVAGPFMNYVLAFFIFFGILMWWGMPIQTNKTEIGEVMAGKPADKAGVLVGDRVLSVEGEKVEDFFSLAEIIHKRPALPTKLVIKRGDQTLDFTITPVNEGNIGIIGIRPADPIEERTKVGMGDAVKKSAIQCWNITYITMYYLGQKIMTMEKPDLAGPVGIAQVINKAAKAGAEQYFYLIGLISVSLGLFNLFPIPLLDGGHLVYYLIEGIRKKPLSAKVMDRANQVGLVLIGAIFFLALYNDIQRIVITKEKPAVVEKK